MLIPYEPTFPSTLHQGRYGGFSLIEAAIVLGVVGLIIGGIWVAASAVNEKLRATEVGKALVLVAQAAGNIFSYADVVTITAGIEVNVTSVFLKAGIIPADWIKGSSVVDPWGHSVIFDIEPQNGYGEPRFDFCLQQVARARCMNIVAAIPTSSLVGVWTELGWNTAATVTPSAVCTATTLNYLCPNFKLTR